MNQKKKSSGLGAFVSLADASASLMAGVFVLAFALIRAEVSDQPPQTVNAMVAISGTVFPDLKGFAPKSGESGRVTVSVNGLSNKLADGESSIQLESNGIIEVSFPNFKSDLEGKSQGAKELLVIIQSKEITQRQEIEIELESESSMFLPTFVDVSMGGSAIHPNLSDRLSRDPQVDVTGISNQRLIVKIIVDPRLENRDLAIQCSRAEVATEDSEVDQDE